MSQRSECCNFFFFFFLKKKRKRVWRVLLLVGLSRIALMRMNVLTDWMMYESFYRLGSSKMLWMVFVDRNLTESLTSRSISETGKLLTGHFQRFIIFTRDCFKFLGEAIPFFINQTASMDDSCVSKKNPHFFFHTVKSQSAWDVQSHCLHVKLLDFAPFVVCAWWNSSYHTVI